MAHTAHTKETIEGESADDQARLSAAGSFIWEDQLRIRAAVSRFPAGGGGSLECELRGGSMADAIPGRSRIRIAVTSGPWQAGQVIAFMMDDRLVVHRLVYQGRWLGGRGYLITRGDRMILPDPPVSRNTVVGTVAELKSGDTWQALNPQVPAPRRERLLSMLVLIVGAASLELIGPRFARWLAVKLESSERQWRWTRALLY